LQREFNSILEGENAKPAIRRGGMSRQGGERSMLAETGGSILRRAKPTEKRTGQEH